MVTAPPELIVDAADPTDSGPPNQALGLTAELARERLQDIGPNEPFPSVQTSRLRQLAPLVINPLAAILLLASAISAIVGETTSAITIAVIVLLGATINFVQTRRSQIAMDKLRVGVTPTALVLRDGTWTEIPRREVVPGDVIRLVAGDIVPADANLIEAKDLHVQEAALTGESLPVEKIVARPKLDAPDAIHRVFLGSSVVSGIATAEVYATGQLTMFGDVATRIARRPPETEFDRGTRRFGLLIARTVFTLVIFAFFVNIARGHDAIQALLFGVALAVGLTPEFLPMITAVTLARGAVRLARRKVIVKHLAAIQNFGSIDVLCTDKTGTLTCGEMKLERSVDPLDVPSRRVLDFAALNSRHETGISNPLDVAILAASTDTPPDYVKIDEIPFDFERRRVTVVVARDGERLLVCKGSPEHILDVCTFTEIGGATVPLDVAQREVCTATYRALCAKGLRVLGIAIATPSLKATYSRADEKQLILVGFVAFLDPPRADTKAALDDLRKDGVSVKMLTGDDDLVTRHVCDQIGMDGRRIILGAELDKMSDGALAHVAETVDVFARVSPAQKNRIILALKSRSHVVGFLGDGINDTPSLRAADVGISVSTAVDVAKEAAEVVLLEPGLRVLHSGIIEGRRAFGNVMKYLLMGTSSNFGNMFSMAGASLFLPFLPMLPAQILLNSLLYDLAQLAIPTDRVDASFTKKPHRWDISLIRNFMLLIGPISSLYDFATFWVLLHVFHASEAAFHTGWFVESLATQTLVLFVIRTAENPIRSRPSLVLAAAVVLVVLTGIALPFTPFAADLGFVPLPRAYFLFLAGATLTYLAVVELGKRKLTGHLLESALGR